MNHNVVVLDSVYTKDLEKSIKKYLDLGYTLLSHTTVRGDLKFFHTLVFVKNQ